MSSAGRPGDARPIYIHPYIAPDEAARAFVDVQANTPWINKLSAPRDECFMALDTRLTYSYGRELPGGPDKPPVPRRTYTASAFHPYVLAVMLRLNAEHPEFGGGFNVCVLNRYADEHQHLGWHADDSPEQDPDHSIAVVSLGAERAIWIREGTAGGLVPHENRYTLAAGSLFVMPPGFQTTHQHRIPRHDRPCGPRVSLTFRKLDR